ncbi:MAG: hypothetical protein BMS9Abin01_1929 [Gammaproteobacteria bacterium]|nr:MAG: hypothetical protein BMS9Abin01_1929 [Gammaproteobacteria bacterium]
MSTQKAVVTAAVLNVRPRASTERPPVGKLERGTVVRVLAKQGRWYRIAANGLTGFVHGAHLRLTDSPAPPRKGVVTARRLNVRPAPSTREPRVGQLERGTRLEVLADADGWYRIRSGEVTGYVYGDFVSIEEAGAGAQYLYERDELRSVALAPAQEERIAVRSDFSARQKLIARSWNRLGGLLQLLSDLVAIDVASSMAVLSVEAGARGFSANGHMIIRFENHIFWSQWGRRNAETYRTHFRYDPDKRWRRHAFRASHADAWAPFHGNQAKEWRVFEFARGLNEPAAMRAISMGAPQIMGFNFAGIGYDSVRAMFDSFQADIRFQVAGLFDFLRGSGPTSPMIQALQRRRFVDFAARYNGPGQAAKYGAQLERDFELFATLLQ